MKENLTYEELVEFSKNPPKWEGETLFDLSTVTISKFYRHRYPKYDVWEDSKRFFHTREEAEQFMHQHKDGKTEFGDQIYCYYLHEYPYYKTGYVSCRVYDAMGQLIDQTLCADIRHYEDSECNIFFGRPAEKLRFKKGDLVEVLDLHKEEVLLGVVYATPVSPEHTWRVCTKMGAYVFDKTDDTYSLVYSPRVVYSDHVAATHVFAPHFKIPDKIRQRFEKYYKAFLEERERLAKEYKMAQKKIKFKKKKGKQRSSETIINGSRVFIEDGEVKTILSEEIQRRGWLTVEESHQITLAVVRKRYELNKMKETKDDK